MAGACIFAFATCENYAIIKVELFSRAGGKKAALSQGDLITALARRTSLWDLL